MPAACAAELISNDTGVAAICQPMGDIDFEAKGDHSSGNGFLQSARISITSIDGQNRAEIPSAKRHRRLALNLRHLNYGQLPF
jgi:hypothetical protein